MKTPIFTVKTGITLLKKGYDCKVDLKVVRILNACADGGDVAVLGLVGEAPHGMSLLVDYGKPWESALVGNFVRIHHITETS